MPIPSLSTAAIEFIVETKLMVEGEYQCDLLNDEITACLAEFNQAAASQTSSLGSSVTMDKEVIQARLDSLLAARNLCRARAAAVTAEASADEVAATTALEDPMARSFDFSKRPMR